MPRKPARDRGVRWGDGYLTERPRRDGSVRWQARWREGAAWRARTFDRQDDAEDHLRTVARAKRDGRQRPATALTVGEMVADYLDRGERGDRWAGGTVFTYRQRTRQHIVPTLGHLPVDRLDTPAVQRWIDDLQRAGLKPGTIQPVHAILNGALAEAVRLGIVDRNVARGIRLATVRTPRPVTWSRAQAAAVLAAASTEPRWHALYHVALTTAMRPGELAALTWADVDLDRARILVRRTVAHRANGGYEVVERTKRGDGRVVPLALPVVASLRRWRREQADGPDVRHRRRRDRDRAAVYVFGFAAPLSSTSWARIHRRLCDAAGVPAIRRHDLRHTAITHLLELGVHPLIVSQLAGHARVEETLNRYSHVDVSMTERAAAQLADWLSGVESNREDTTTHQLNRGHG